MTKKRTHREPVRVRHADGSVTVHVPLANHPKPAVLLAADFDRLVVEHGVSSQWTLNAARGYGYVRVKLSALRNIQTVARLVMGAGPRQIVKCADGDPLNLRRDNLYLTSGYAKRSAALPTEASPPVPA